MRRQTEASSVPLALQHTSGCSSPRWRQERVGKKGKEREREDKWLASKGATGSRCVLASLTTALTSLASRRQIFSHPFPLPSSSPHPRFPERHHPPAPTPPRPPSPPPTLLHASRATSCLAGPEEFVFTCVFVCTRRELRRPLLKCGATCRNISAGASHALLTAWHDEILPPSTTTLPGLLLCSVLHLKKKRQQKEKQEREREGETAQGEITRVEKPRCWS